VSTITDMFLAALLHLQEPKIVLILVACGVKSMLAEYAVTAVVIIIVMIITERCLIAIMRVM
jgi:hypothetical protein